MEREKSLGKNDADGWLNPLRKELRGVDRSFHRIIGRAEKFPQIPEDEETPTIGVLIEGFGFEETIEAERKEKLWELFKARVNLACRVGIVKSHFGLVVYQPKVEQDQENSIRRRARRGKWPPERLDCTLALQRAFTRSAKDIQYILGAPYVDKEETLALPPPK